MSKEITTFKRYFISTITTALSTWIVVFLAWLEKALEHWFEWITTNFLTALAISAWVSIVRIVVKALKEYNENFIWEK